MTTDYERYIRTDELLALQKASTELANHDELLFQVTHQSSELWMKAALHDVQEATGLLRSATGDQATTDHTAAEPCRYPPVERATYLLLRAARLMAMVGGQVLILEQMAPAEYQVIRTALGRGSGQDSPGFNRLLQAAAPLRDAYWAWMSNERLDLLEVLRHPHNHGKAHGLIQALLEFDEQFHRFRQNHLSLVRRVIGLNVLSIKGLPAAKLVAGTQVFVFPELWDAISELTNNWNGPQPPDSY